jgi:hypothetical protein
MTLSRSAAESRFTSLLPGAKRYLEAYSWPNLPRAFANVRAIDHGNDLIKINLDRILLKVSGF